MHFSKTYSQLLQELPPELSENAVNYRQLKKLINQLVTELASLGLGPAVLQDLLGASGKGKGKETCTRVEYEFNHASGHIEPRLRLWVDPPNAPSPPTSSHIVEVEEDETESELPSSQVSLLWSLQQHTLSPDSSAAASNPESDTMGHHGKVEVVIPLVSDTAFFELLLTALHGLTEHLRQIHAQFVTTLAEITKMVSDSARPVSSTSHGFRAFSALRSDAGGVRVDAASGKSDLYSWREIFQLYVESEIFENVSERHRGERSVEDAETRLKMFAERVTTRGLGDGRKLRLAQSRKALESFLQLNLFILNVKKFELANAEATRKILKKHTKRTALPSTDASNTTPLDLIPIDTNASLPRIMVQELGTTLLPIIPSIDDYTCLICTSIAFKPIRLACGHLFCVRCLVKMQKRGSAHCPMCRSPCVLVADRSNVDWALLNFMRDWFPEESSLKLSQNEKEATKEQLEEMGIDPDEKCVVM
ncbi:SPX domain-containing protein [Favolaschia claudopus]|uniref:SPX domain-containing protein n=1 Tax=Favolaschia claudopus TaxID=2862362 RepID=A0AAW0D134_9AGAR